MKTTILLLTFICFSVVVVAQETSDVSASPGLTRQNVVKFLPVSLYFNSIAFEYEHKYSPHNSFFLGLGIPTNKPFSGKLYGSGTTNTDDMLGFMSIMGAWRHYFKRHLTPVGFYFSPYLKYQHFSMHVTENKNIGTPMYYNEIIKADGSTLNAGLQFGTQFLIAKRVCIDLYLSGIEIGLANLTGVVTTTSTTDPTVITQIRKNVDDFISDLPPIIRDKIAVTQSSNQINVKANSLPYPWYRMGISIGFAF